MEKKTERINFRVTEYDKMKLLQQADMIGTDLSSYCYDILRRSYNNDYIDYFIDAVKQVIESRDDLKKYDNVAILEYKLDNGEIAYSCKHLKNTYFGTWELIDAFNDNIKNKIPFKITIWLLDNWEAVKYRLIRLGWYEVDNNEIR